MGCPPGGKLVFEETDGIDYAASTVQLPGGERVPFLFTVKDLVAKGATDGSTIKPGYEFGGSFTVPSYRTGLFLDPKGRGMSTGNVEFEIQNVNTEESEFSGVFVSAQPSDTDLGGKEPKKLLLKGIFYGKIEQ